MLHDTPFSHEADTVQPEVGAIIPRPTDVSASDDGPPVFRNRAFMALWLGQFVAFFGTSVFTLAMMWEMKVLTGSTVMMSAVSMASLIPMIILGPLAGVMVDRWAKRRAMIASDIIRGAVITLLTLALALHIMNPWLLIAGAAINSAAGTVYNPANMALIPLLVGRDRLQQANSISQGTTILTQIVGPLVAGLLIGNVNMTSAFALNAVTYAVSVGSLLLIRFQEPARKTTALNAQNIWLELKEGIQTIRSVSLMRILIPVALLANFLFAPFELILIQYCSVTLHGGAQLYGTLGACFAAGMLVGAVLAGTLAKWFRAGMIVAFAFPLSNVFLFALAYTRIVWIALLLGALFGLFNMLVNVTLMTLIQKKVPQEQMGRVFGSFGLLIQGAQPVAQAAAGYLLTWFAAPTLMAVISILDLVNALYAAVRREVWQAE